MKTELVRDVRAVKGEISVLALAGKDGNIFLTALICSGVVPQQPPK